jgi:hypothetical protein
MCVPPRGNFPRCSRRAGHTTISRHFRYVAVHLFMEAYRCGFVPGNGLLIECRSDGFREMEVLYKTAYVSPGLKTVGLLLGTHSVSREAGSHSFLESWQDLGDTVPRLLSKRSTSHAVSCWLLSWRVRPVVDDRVSTTMDTRSDRLLADRIHDLHLPPESVIPRDVRRNKPDADGAQQDAMNGPPRFYIPSIPSAQPTPRSGRRSNGARRRSGRMAARHMPHAGENRSSCIPGVNKAPCTASLLRLRSVSESVRSSTV